MMFLFGLLLGACAAFQPATSSVSIVDRPALAAEVKERTVALIREKGEGLEPYCAAVWVSSTSLLTAAHCLAHDSIGDTVEYSLDSPHPLGRRAVFYAIDEEHDLALLRATYPPPHEVAELGQEPAQGSDVVTMGHSLGMPFSFSSGVIGAVRNYEGVHYVQTTTPTSPGNSGGGLFDAQCRLVGVAHGILPMGQNMNLYISVFHVRTLLNAQGAL